MLSENGFYKLKRGEFFIRGTDLKSPEADFKYPQNSETGTEYPKCCPSHTRMAEGIYSWFEKFPNCCQPHIEMAKNPLFKLSDYKNLPDKIIRQIAYTESFILNKLQSTDWFKQISDYLEANEFSFGEPSIGYDRYINHIENFILTAQNIAISEEQRNTLKEYIRQKEPAKPTVNLNVLYRTYQKWLKLFPFELSIFSELRHQMVSTLPFLCSGTEQYNPYTGLTKVTLVTEKVLLESLVNMTKQILGIVDTKKMLEDGIIKDSQKYFLDIANEHHRIEQTSLLMEFQHGETNYLRIVKKWLRNEKTWIVDVRAFFDNPHTGEVGKQEMKLKLKLQKLGFFSILKLRELKEEKKQRLLEMIVENQLPYQLAMMHFLGFITHIEETNKFYTKAKLYDELAVLIFDDKKKSRAIKGNLLTLNIKSHEDKSKYTAHRHVESVRKDYKSLK